MTCCPVDRCQLWLISLFALTFRSGIVAELSCFAGARCPSFWFRDSLNGCVSSYHQLPHEFNSYSETRCTRLKTNARSWSTEWVFRSIEIQVRREVVVGVSCSLHSSSTGCAGEALDALLPQHAHFLHPSPSRSYDSASLHSCISLG